MAVSPQGWNSAELSSGRCSAAPELWDFGRPPVISQFLRTLTWAECRLLPPSAQGLSHSQRHRVFIVTVTLPHPERVNLPSAREGAGWPVSATPWYLQAPESHHLCCDEWGPSWTKPAIALTLGETDSSAVAPNSWSKVCRWQLQALCQGHGLQMLISVSGVVLQWTRQWLAERYSGNWDANAPDRHYQLGGWNQTIFQMLIVSEGLISLP